MYDGFIYSAVTTGTVSGILVPALFILCDVQHVDVMSLGADKCVIRMSVDTLMRCDSSALSHEAWVDQRKGDERVIGFRIYGNLRNQKSRKKTGKSTVSYIHQSKMRSRRRRRRRPR